MAMHNGELPMFWNRKDSLGNVCNILTGNSVLLVVVEDFHNRMVQCGWKEDGGGT